LTSRVELDFLVETLVCVSFPWCMAVLCCSDALSWATGGGVSPVKSSALKIPRNLLSVAQHSMEKLWNGGWLNRTRYSVSRT